MKKKEFQSLRTKDVAELRKLLTGKRKDVLDKRMGISTAKEKNLKVVKNLRQEVAQILTVIREKEIIGKIDKPDQKKDKESPKSGKK
ncbi:MAG: hypothetical protein UX13_C0043G0014 [Candidatus Woesebacteria bacterium GW2011_GWB1_45_5]|uniref:Large ribosomal subunit protein uL29 n=1 Tax=Candidatus Woesebacteria bacterium GW2011_GWB1_45_5 TaxID=1618581 RepID=A0A0G1PV22_9BACT|nr:MAG: hypothetical protein UX13_C0043G0014 [Candidatus Woesebacteria bacterium GW2011_GWB1_45_5]